MTSTCSGSVMTGLVRSRSTNPSPQADQLPAPSRARTWNALCTAGAPTGGSQRFSSESGTYAKPASLLDDQDPSFGSSRAPLIPGAPVDGGAERIVERAAHALDQGDGVRCRTTDPDRDMFGSKLSVPLLRSEARRRTDAGHLPAGAARPPRRPASGADASTVNATSVAADVLPRLSVAVTETVCAPSLRLATGIVMSTGTVTAGSAMVTVPAGRAPTSCQATLVTSDSPR